MRASSQGEEERDREGEKEHAAQERRKMAKQSLSFRAFESMHGFRNFLLSSTEAVASRLTKVPHLETLFSPSCTDTRHTSSHHELKKGFFSLLT